MADDYLNVGGKKFKLVDLGDGTFGISCEAEITSDVEVNAIQGTATGGSTTTVTDSTKNFEADLFNGKTIKVTIGGVEYFRKITDVSANTITFPATVDAVAAKAVIGHGAEGIVTITCATAGAAGNAYTVVVVEAPGTDDTLSAAFADSVLTIYLGKTGGVVDDLENTAVLVAAKIDELAEFTAVVTQAGVVVVAELAPFTGGIDAIPVVAGTEYAVEVGETKVLAEVTGSSVEDVTFLDAVNAPTVGEWTNTAKKSLLVEIYGSETNTARTVQFKAKGPSGTARTLMGVKMSDFSTGTSTTGTGELWSFDITGTTSVIIDLTAITDGTVSAKGRAVA